MDVWDEGDDQLDLGQLGVQGSRVIDVQGDGVGVLDALAELLGALEGTAGCFIPSLAGGLSVKYTAVFYIEAPRGKISPTNSQEDTGLAQLVDGRLSDCQTEVRISANSSVQTLSLVVVSEAARLTEAASKPVIVSQSS
ncbi:hypothetical protein TRV_04692 [Trichophyton verrucosum HKI 0517]|uniref:Uncharacterized protein n=1 Tax=Trichophyton verrucosum (strain HKI 0517) TaxID=663202 RepID=D4DC40_TRIVH|nr:uncharacterized protein TRV_04692 [Trichophyton verrucosum HKI 0517]EFE40642.1 hypothetical protein TRV_04692 [Trichophyton verrucosum HKI 0517]